ncbi:MAG: response regulator [Planctomycetes bacterium]|nr:response regulator [Planctomycetota bacterium]
MTVGLLREVIALYEREAYPEGAPAAREVPGADADPLESVLPAFNDESQCTSNTQVRRYTMRLGNARYPFMKIVLQEHLVEGEFFFEVDTHDQMFRLEGEEAAKFEPVRRYNADVRERVDAAWCAAHIPTAASLKGLVQTLPLPRARPNGRRILVVDDDAAIASTVALMLEARGYEVECLSDGLEAVDQADPARHDLILMDNDMVHLSGFEACHILKSREGTRDIPVLIATAGALTLRQLDDADGFLVKPFRIELLLSMLDHLLNR